MSDRRLPLSDREPRMRPRAVCTLFRTGVRTGARRCATCPRAPAALGEGWQTYVQEQPDSAGPSEGESPNDLGAERRRLTLVQGLEVKKTGFGLGVFLTEPAKEGDLISGTLPTSC